MLDCPKCNYPLTHPLGLTVVGGECSGCYTHREKNKINWSQKRHDLDLIFGRIKKKRRGYDCVVPVTGDAEDYYVVNIVCESGLNPLLVSVNDYFKNDVGWYNLQNLITHFDLDSIIHNPDLNVYKELVRTSLRKFNHARLPFLQLHTAFPVHIAADRNIPLVIWGQNQAVEQVGKFSHDDEVRMTRWSRRQHDLLNVEIDSLIGNGAQIQERSLSYYEYPSVRRLGAKGVQGIYLSNFLRWDPLIQNQSTLEHGFHPTKQYSTFDVYERAGHSLYYSLHDLLKQKRCGYRKIHDHAAREVRHGRLTPNEGKRMAEEYGAVPVRIKPFFDWLGTTKSGYDWFVSHRLSDVKSLVTDCQPVEPSLSIPDKVRNLLVDAHLPKHEYLTFSKQLFI